MTASSGTFLDTSYGAVRTTDVALNIAEESAMKRKERKIGKAKAEDEKGGKGGRNDLDRKRNSKSRKNERRLLDWKRHGEDNALHLPGQRVVCACKLQFV